MVRTGLQALLEERLDLLAGLRAGLVSHSAATLPDLTSNVDALLRAGVRLTALFGAEHGFSGAAADGARVADSVDRHSGLPVYSLYGESFDLPPEALGGVDVLVVDFQDAGARFYTYLSTLYYVLRGAGAANVPVIVLDRPNPLGGATVEGPSVEPGFASFIGIAPVPIRHGMTLGELAQYLNGEHDLGAALTVVPMQGWRREMWFDQTGLPWVPPSPAMPHLSTAAVYPGMCLVEGTNLSEGRGTALPFEAAGAPWLDGYALAEALNGLGLPGVRFRPHQFRPAAGKHAGQVCEGVQVHITDRAAFRPVAAGVQFLAAARAQAPESFAFLPAVRAGQPPHIDLLYGSARLRELIEAGRRVDDLPQRWAAFHERFARARRPYLLYDP